MRITHWINAVAVVLMILSGWEIYNASPLFPFRFPPAITLGGWLAGALLWHFAAMWLLVVNGLVYLALGLATGRFRRKLVPIRPASCWPTPRRRSPAGSPMTTSRSTTRSRSCSISA